MQIDNKEEGNEWLNEVSNVSLKQVADFDFNFDFKSDFNFKSNFDFNFNFDFDFGSRYIFNLI